MQSQLKDQQINMGKIRRNTEKLKNFVVQLTEIEQAPENIL